ncbi:DNA-directed RNA polymerase, sigma subunit RpoH [Elusimicrobium minutum Pei191]|uniref:RNA polymerase sigma factor n=1 Tax=Elusimicrobium minutum (strain Pei191) TaxID=445932 RepID=B2KCU1_ELUMP|nr:sigma-70 family RNA polymerase sigma factor [Elusimicrobium minutum]ACC98337.1 DNA-directed RNA polymerase, sigma subunit RpoH [Elusimicrobium minutum Pei191]
MSENVDSINQYFKKISEVSEDLSREEMEKLWKRIKKGDTAAKQRMMELNLRLVIPAAKRFMRKDIDLLDLIEEGNLGLLQAIEKFDPSKGFRFSTYAIYWIDQAIRKYIDEQSGAIKIPSHAWGDIKKWTRTWNALKDSLEREPSLTEMSRELDWSARKIKSILETINAAKGIDSLALAIGEEDEVTLEDTLTDDGKGNPDDVFSRSSSNSALLAALEELNPRDKEILMMRNGLKTNEPMTLSEVSKIMGLSRERVRQIEERAISHIRKKAHKLGILETHNISDRRTRQIHTGMELKNKTNVLGEIVGTSALEKLLKKRMEEIKLREAAKRAKSAHSFKKTPAKAKKELKKTFPAKEKSAKIAVSRIKKTKTPQKNKKKK